LMIRVYKYSEMIENPLKVLIGKITYCVINLFVVVVDHMTK
jgi:hypothetical protein